ncbi:hypothetical protein EIP91_003809 [Steccherinum ochraceum]|uniref:RlpA-like protein double-psi beta-barrel domain-containing protein n=1 Tax=Steccherinum ochraceum TaxID=92696 RepID=A0A4R0RIB6_9APHY|nr:hypothetical protein EIP91_003809 [Steccherinum ochraceum]
MFALAAFTTLALSAVSAVSGLVVPRASKPTTYAEGYLEPYNTYHTRYMAIQCYNKHSTPFFDACCHPLLATETLEANRAPECNPANQVSSSASSTQPAPTASDDGDCDEEPTSTAAPAPSSTHSATFFYQKGNQGACGHFNSDDALIAAMDKDRYGYDGNASPLCGKQVEITNTKNGKKVTVTVADDCPTCNNGNSIDLSVGAFTQIATKDDGEVPISWRFL